MDLVQLNRTRTFGNAIFRTLGMDTRGKEWSSALNMPNSFAALHANITADGTRGVEKANQEFAVGILSEGWQAYSLVRDGMDPGGTLPRAVIRWYGAKWSKTTVWRTRGLRQLVPSAAALTPPAAGFPSLSHSSAFFERDADERRRKRSAYDETYAAGVVACWDLLATFASSDSVAAAPLFDELRDAVAANFAAAGGTLPAGWQSIWALPPGGDDSARLLLAPAAVRVSRTQAQRAGILRAARRK